MLCGGTGITSENATLRGWIDELGLRDVVHLLGRRQNLPRLMAALLFGTSPLDPMTYGVVALGVLVVAVLASAIPAHRAAAVDPVLALRGE